MPRPTTVLVLAPVLSLGMVLFGPEQEEAQSREGEEADTATLVCASNPCFDLGVSDTLLGTDYNEQIHALQGSDRVGASSGSDIIAGDEDLQEE